MSSRGIIQLFQSGMTFVSHKAYGCSKLPAYVSALLSASEVHYAVHERRFIANLFILYTNQRYI
jgi:hypothetical protein